jgi:hypothetical protein
MEERSGHFLRSGPEQGGDGMLRHLPGWASWEFFGTECRAIPSIHVIFFMDGIINFLLPLGLKTSGS